MTDFSRRALLEGAAVTAAFAAFVGVEAILPATAVAQNPDSDQSRMNAFIRVSAILTGIDSSRLSPTVDPFNVKLQYFKRAESAKPEAFARLLRIVDAHPANDDALGESILKQSDDSEICFLGRSIILAWYLGAWYDPDLLAQSAANHSDDPLPYEIVSPAAYTQGWVWRVAQAHPMGYSNLQFGYWNEDPKPLATFIGPPPKG